MEDFAELLGMSKDGYRMIEVNGWPNLKRITQIAELLEVDIEYFYKEDRPESIENMANIIAEQARLIDDLQVSENPEYDDAMKTISKARGYSPDQFDLILGLAKIIIKDAEDVEEDKKEA